MARFRTTSGSFRDATRRIWGLRLDMDTLPGQAVRAIGEEIMTDVKASAPGRGVPVHTGYSPSTGKPTGRTGGTLRSTGQVNGPDSAGVVSLSFGGAAAPYAVVQHERVDYQHNLGEARYLIRGLERWNPLHSEAMDALGRNTRAAIRAQRSKA